MKKKLLSMLLVAGMTVSLLAGCGNTATADDNAATTDEGTAAADESTAADEDATADDAAAADGATFLIGGIGPLTGAAASYGISVK